MRMTWSEEMRQTEEGHRGEKEKEKQLREEGKEREVAGRLLAGRGVGALQPVPWEGGRMAELAGGFANGSFGNGRQRERMRRESCASQCCLTAPMIDVVPMIDVLCDGIHGLGVVRGRWREWLSLVMFATVGMGRWRTRGARRR